MDSAKRTTSKILTTITDKVRSANRKQRAVACRWTAHRVEGINDGATHDDPGQISKGK